MNPVLVIPPEDPVVTLPMLKEHLRVVETDHDALIAAFGEAAVAYLDGWRGLLGRAIMPQTWEETFTGGGPYRLSLPDVIEATVTADGTVVSATVTAEAMGPLVALDVSADGAVIQYQCGLPVSLLPAAQAAVMLYVEHLRDGTDLSPAFYSMVSMLRRKEI